MFIIKYFKNTLYSLKGIYRFKDEKGYKIMLYFLLMSLISLLPHNLTIIQENGFKMGFISEGYNDSNKEQLYNSSLIKIGKAGLRVEDTFKLEEYEFDTFKLVIDYNDEYEVTDDTTLILKKYTTEYHSNNSMMYGDYNSFEDDIYIANLMFDDNVYMSLFTNLEKAFYPYITLFSLLVNTTANIAMYLLMILLMGIILGFLKYKYSSYLSYKEIVKILVLSMTLPSVVVFIIGLFGGFAFTPVIMNFMIGGIGVLTILKVGKNNFDSK